MRFTFIFLIVLLVVFFKRINSLSTASTATFLTPNQQAVLDLAYKTLNGTFNAGGSYPQVWIRDTATFLRVGLAVNAWSDCRQLLIGFIQWQQSEGEIADGYIVNAPIPENHTDAPFTACLGEGEVVCKNTVETDQESSLLRAFAIYVNVTNDIKILTQIVDGKTVLSRLELSLIWLFAHRFSAAHSLIYGATTDDWGDCQPEGDVADLRMIDPLHSHLSVDVYDNAMLYGAIGELLMLAEKAGQRLELGEEEWKRRANSIKENVRKYLWDETNNKFRPHVYLNTSPFPSSFDESSLYYHGGTTVAGLVGLLSVDEISLVYSAMTKNVEAVNNSGGSVTLGLTIYPPYPQMTGLTNQMPVYNYQNGGDWDWFGGRTITLLLSSLSSSSSSSSTSSFNLNDVESALEPMLTRVLNAGDFYEWWDFNGKPMGSNGFKGAAGALGEAILNLANFKSIAPKKLA